MFGDTDILSQLKHIQQKRITAGENVVQEANKILNQDLFSDKKILENLGKYNDLSLALDEDNLERARIFNSEEIKYICTTHRLKFLGSKLYKPEIPYPSIMMIKELNLNFRKELKEFKILAPAETFVHKKDPLDSMLFATTNDGNFYLINRWGRSLKWYRKILFWPMRQFENLFITVALVTLIITLSLPTWLITLDHKAEYWSGYRAAAFFHILIFNMGVTAYITFAFAKNFSSTVWNREQDFG